MAVAPAVLMFGLLSSTPVGAYPTRKLKASDHTHEELACKLSLRNRLSRQFWSFLTIGEKSFGFLTLIHRNELTRSLLRL